MWRWGQGILHVCLVFDSASTAMGTGLLALAAAEAAQGRSVSVEEVLQLLGRLRDSLRIYLAVPTLKYLQKSGHVNLTQALVGMLLNIKPILSTEQGLVNVVEKTRSWPAAINRVLWLAKEAAGGRRVVVAVQHAWDLPGARALAAKARDELNVERLYISQLSVSLAMHGGPGMLGLAVYPAAVV